MTGLPRFLAIDEGCQTLSLVDPARPAPVWVRSLADLPLARTLQSLGPRRVLAGFDRGWFEFDPETGEILGLVDRWTGVTGVHRQGDGTTLVAGPDLGGLAGVTVLTCAPDGTVRAAARRDGDYVRLVRATAQGTWLLSTNDHILEARPDLTEVRRLAAPGFLHAWQTHRFADGSTLVSAGYGACLARFDADGRWLGNFGGVNEVPDEVQPFFYAGFMVLGDGRTVVANWQGHGPGNHAKGRQLVAFSAGGTYLGSWPAPPGISSLQGLLEV